MRRAVTTTLLVLTCTGLALAGGPTWVKWDAAKAMAAATGKPIAVYCTVDQDGGSC